MQKKVLLIVFSLLVVAGCGPVVPLFVPLPVNYRQPVGTEGEVILLPFQNTSSEPHVVGELLTLHKHQRIETEQHAITTMLFNSVADELEKQGIFWQHDGEQWDGTLMGLPSPVSGHRMFLKGYVTHLWLTKNNRLAYHENSLELNVEFRIGLPGRHKVITRTVQVNQKQTTVGGRTVEDVLRKGVSEAAQKVTNELQSMLERGERQ